MEPLQPGAYYGVPRERPLGTGRNFSIAEESIASLSLSLSHSCGTARPSEARESRSSAPEVFSRAGGRSGARRRSVRGGLRSGAALLGRLSAEITRVKDGDAPRGAEITGPLRLLAGGMDGRRWLEGAPSLAAGGGRAAMPFAAAQEKSITEPNGEKNTDFNKALRP